MILYGKGHLSLWTNDLLVRKETHISPLSVLIKGRITSEGIEGRDGGEEIRIETKGKVSHLFL